MKIRRHLRFWVYSCPCLQKDIEYATGTAGLDRKALGLWQKSHQIPYMLILTTVVPLYLGDAHVAPVLEGDFLAFGHLVGIISFDDGHRSEPHGALPDLRVLHNEEKRTGNSFLQLVLVTHRGQRHDGLINARGYLPHHANHIRRPAREIARLL